jgi:hypothetical protein
METLMFDFSHFYDKIAQDLPNNCKICEIGVADGHSALYLAERLHYYGKNFKLYMVDNMDYGKYEQIKTIYTNIIKSGLGEFIEVIPYDSITASKKFNDGYLDFLFLDSSHEYQETKDSIVSWYPKLKDLCIFSGHDFYCDEVNLAVKELVPKFIVRTDIPERNFDAEQFLFEEDTTNGYGIFYFTKDFYKKLNK